MALWWGGYLPGFLYLILVLPFCAAGVWMASPVKRRYRKLIREEETDKR
jgi:hypothetical protein